MKTLTMARTVLALGWIGTAVLAATLVYRFAITAEGAYSRIHVLSCVFATLLIVLSHLWVMLFLIGSGLAIRRTVREHALDPLIVESHRRLQLPAMPISLAAMAAVILTFAYRAGSLGEIPIAGSAAGIGVAVVALQAWALWLEGRTARVNESVLDQVGTRLQAAAG